LIAVIAEAQFLFQKPGCKVWEEMMWGVECPCYNLVEGVMNSQQAMRHQDHPARFFPFQYITAKNLYTQLRWNVTRQHLCDQRREPTPEPTPPLPKTPPAPTGNNSGAQDDEILNFPAGIAYSHTHFPVLHIPLLMRLPSIPSIIQMWIQLYWLTKEHPLVGTISAVA
jgi:hypothetical protein